MEQSQALQDAQIAESGQIVGRWRRRQNRIDFPSACRRKQRRPRANRPADHGDLCIAQASYVIDDSFEVVIRIAVSPEGAAALHMTPEIKGKYVVLAGEYL